MLLVARWTIEQHLPEADLVIGAVLVHGAQGAARDHARAARADEARTPCSSTSSIDQGGCFETSRATTHSDPTYEVDGITHYCVANMPGAVPVTSTYALTNATMPYVIKLADRGRAPRAGADPGFMEGLNVAAGQVTYEPVALDQGRDTSRPRRRWRRSRRPDPATAVAASLAAPRRPPSSS